MEIKGKVQTRDERIAQIKRHISFLKTIKTGHPLNLENTISYWENEINRLKELKREKMFKSA